MSVSESEKQLYSVFFLGGARKFERGFNWNLYLLVFSFFSFFLKNFDSFEDLLQSKLNFLRPSVSEI